MTTENLSTLKINLLTQSQYDNAVENGAVEENAMYLIPDDMSYLREYATKRYVDEAIATAISNAISQSYD